MDPSPPAIGEATHFQIFDDGTVISADITYDSASAYHRSAAFRGAGRRCATPRPTVTLFAPSDCSFDQTSIEPDYQPLDLYQIPVVFHLIERTDGYGHVPDQLVLSQLDILNEDFLAIADTPGAPGSNTRTAFVLATTDPQGNPTTGVMRHVSDEYFTDPGPGAMNEMKAALNWDTSRYFNIYSNDGSGDGTLGYATFPQLSAGAYDDGIVLNWAHIGRHAPNGGDFDQGRTATHEVGHYLGLFHTFQDGCGTPGIPYASGDRIADTVPEADPHFGCSPGPSACGGGDNPIDNYMDYSNDTCMSRFTPEQINRMRCSLIHYRSGLYIQPGAPEAAFLVTVDDLDAAFTDHSTDQNGSIVGWSWRFGDGASSTEPSPSHRYARPGVYRVLLTVTDDEGYTGTTRQQVVAGRPPRAGFRSRASGLRAQFTDASTDPDGRVTGWQWEFGDGASSAQPNPVHVYALPGTYTVTLTATDDDGLPSSSSSQVMVAAAPDAAFSYAVDELTVRFADESAVPAGAVASWSWTFGDGASSTEANPVHTYAGGGLYQITLTVTDSAGATGTAQRALVVNSPPAARFAHVAGELTVRFTDHSTDADGSIRNRRWAFGDGDSSTEESPVHTYAAPGTYMVTLTVSDNVGSSRSTTADITVAPLQIEMPDAGAPDAGAPDAMPTVPGPGAGGTTGADGGGCSVAAAARRQQGASTLLCLLAALALVYRRRR